MIAVEIFEHEGKYGLMRADDGRHLYQHGTGFDNLWSDKGELLELLDDPASPYLLLDGRTYADAYAAKAYPDIPILNELPRGWYMTTGSTTAPDGLAWAHNGSFFLRDKYGRVCGKNPDFAQALVRTA